MVNWIFWAIVLSSLIHIAEEYFGGWIGWVQRYAKENANSGVICTLNIIEIGIKNFFFLENFRQRRAKAKKVIQIVFFKILWKGIIKLNWAIK